MQNKQNALIIKRPSPFSSVSGSSTSNCQLSDASASASWSVIVGSGMMSVSIGTGTGTRLFRVDSFRFPIPIRLFRLASRAVMTNEPSTFRRYTSVLRCKRTGNDHRAQFEMTWKLPKIGPYKQTMSTFDSGRSSKIEAGNTDLLKIVQSKKNCVSWALSCISVRLRKFEDCARKNCPAPTSFTQP